MNVEPLAGFPAEWERPQTHIALSNPGARQAIFGDDAALNVRFMMYPEINEFKTKLNTEKGIFKKEIEYKEYVRIQRIGDKLQVYFQPVRPKDIARFPLQYQAFKNGTQDKVMGIPLESWDYQLTETQIYTMKILGVEYVHQLAEMSPVQAESLGIDAQHIIARAKIDTSEAEEKKAKTALQAQLDEMERKYQDAIKQINDLAAARQADGSKEAEALAKYVDKVAATAEAAPKRKRTAKIQVQSAGVE